MIKSAYIHIPFCTKICSYCDFPKLCINKYVDEYLNSLSYEIDKYYKNETLKTIYIGGGTPSSLSLIELEKLFKILNKFKLEKNYEYTIECNLDSLTKEKLDLFKKHKINRLSIGIQTFNKDLLKKLNRENNNIKILKYAKKLFDNINVDLIYAIPGETLKDLENDLKEILKLNICHISTYSLIIEENTILGINKTKSIDEELDLKMYELIIKELEKNDYIHYEISNFSKKGYESKHNLNYWNNGEYYGFGMGASGYIKNIRYTNTKSITKYIKKDYRYEIEKLNNDLKMDYEMILGLRKIEGVDILNFRKKYHRNIDDVYDIIELIKEGKLIKDSYLKINKKYLYLSNDILINFIR